MWVKRTRTAARHEDGARREGVRLELVDRQLKPGVKSRRELSVKKGVGKATASSLG